jgi:hypothetical protein
MAERYSNVILDKKEAGVSVEGIQDLYEKQDYSFLEEAKATWHVEWIGQAIRNELDYQDYKTEEADPNYEWWSDENMDGFEEYRDFFVDQNIRNQKHHDILKDRIARNIYHRKVRDQAGLLPQFSAALADPITYTPLTFIKGATFASRFAKGAGTIGGLQTATELPVRRQLDPTLSQEESAAYIFGSMIFGGAINGMIGKSIPGSATDRARKISDSDEGIDNTMKEMWDIEHVKFKADVLDDQKPDVKYKFNDDGTEININITNNNSYKGLAIANEDGNVMINYRNIVNLFQSNNYRNYFDGFNIPEFRTASDLIDYFVQSAVIKQKNPKLNAFQVHDKVTNNVLKGINERGLAGNKFVQKIGTFFSDYEEVVANKLSIQGGSLAKMAEKLVSDFGTKSRANEYGFATENSAIIEHQVEHIVRIKKASTLLNDIYLRYVTGTGSAGRIKDYDLKAGRTKAGMWVNKKLNKYGKEGFKYKKNLEFNDFNILVGKAMRSEKAYKEADDPIREGADMLREIFDDLGQQGADLGMFASQKSYDNLVAKLQIRKNEVDALFKVSKGAKKKRVGKLQKEINRQLAGARRAANEFEDVNELNPLLKNYVPRVYDIDRIIDDLTINDDIWIKSGKNVKLKDQPISDAVKKNKEYKNYINKKEFYMIPAANSLRGILFRAKLRDLKGQGTTFETNVAVQRQIDNLLRDANRVDMDGDLGIGKAADGSVKFGQSNFMGRGITATDEELDAYLIHDINYLVQTYSDRIGKRIAVAKRFGDANMNDALIEMEYKLLRDDWTPKTAKEIDVQLQRMYDLKDKYYNVFNNADPTSFWKSRLPMFLKNWASLAYMGEATFAATVDAARVPMTHGFDNMWKYLGGSNAKLGGDPELAKGIKANAWLYDAIEVQLNNASQARFMEIGTQVGRKTGMINQKFDKANNALQRLQSPFYHINLLSGWTKVMKDWTANISSHRFLEDCVKVAEGKASKFDIERLLTYGISQRDAARIGRLPIKKTKNNYHYANVDDWAKVPDGEYLGNKLRYAIAGDVSRTIITPNIADKPNMMYGVIKVRNETWNKALNNGFGRWLGYEEKRFGGQINNGFLVLPMQFWSWSVAANRKLTVSGLGQGRDASLAGGLAAMIFMGNIANYLKNPSWYENQSEGERAFRAIELSGVVDLAMQVNNMFETASYAFDDPMGLRTVVGLEPRFKNQDALDAVGGIGGAGPSVFLDTLMAFIGDDSFEGKAANLRRSLPFQNLLWWDMFFHPYKKLEKGITSLVD